MLGSACTYTAAGDFKCHQSAKERFANTPVPQNIVDSVVITDNKPQVPQNSIDTVVITDSNYSSKQVNQGFTVLHVNANSINANLSKSGKVMRNVTFEKPYTRAQFLEALGQDWGTVSLTSNIDVANLLQEFESFTNNFVVEAASNGKVMSNISAFIGLIEVFGSIRRLVMNPPQFWMIKGKIETIDDKGGSKNAFAVPNGTSPVAVTFSRPVRIYNRIIFDNAVMSRYVLGMFRPEAKEVNLNFTLRFTGR